MGRQLQVGVGVDDRGVVAPQLGVEGLHVLGRDPAQLQARLDAAGEGDEVDAGVCRQGWTDAAAAASDHLVGASRQAAFLEDCGKPQ